MLGLSLHSLLDGVALASAVAVDAMGGHDHGWPAGFGVFLAVFLHKPLDALSITSLMANRKSTDSSLVKVNLIYSLVCPLGVVLFLTVSNLAADQKLGMLLGMTLGFSAGGLSLHFA